MKSQGSYGKWNAPFNEQFEFVTWYKIFLFNLQFKSEWITNIV
jgi:hypothetical protein